MRLGLFDPAGTDGDGNFSFRIENEQAGAAPEPRAAGRDTEGVTTRSRCSIF